MLRFFYNAEINNQSQAGEHPSHKQRRDKTFMHTPACLMYKQICLKCLYVYTAYERNVYLSDTGT